MNGACCDEQRAAWRADEVVGSGLVLGRDHNSARTILSRGLALLAQLPQGNAESHTWGEKTRYAARTTVLRKASR